MSTIAIDARHIKSTTGRYIYRLLEHLCQLPTPHRFVVLAPPSACAELEKVLPGMQLVACPYRLYSIGEQVGLLRQLRDIGADLTHFCMPSQPVMYRGLVVTTFHDLTQLSTSGQGQRGVQTKITRAIARHLYRAVARRSAIVITPSETTKRAVVDFAGISPSRVRVTLEAADFSADSRMVAYPPLAQRQFLLYVGTYAPYKNVRCLVDAHRELRTEYPELLLVLAGNSDPTKRGSSAEIQRWTEGRDEGIIYTGYVADETLRWMYQACAAYVFPSFSEGFGLPGLEAMACGAPVVSSSASCLPEIYADGAVYFDPRDPRELAAVLARLLANPVQRLEMSRKGVARAAQFSWQRMARQTLDLYHEVLDASTS